MLFQDPWFYAALIFGLLALIGWIPVILRNINPLIQIPNDQPHHVFFFEDRSVRQRLMEVMNSAGQKPFGFFTAGVDQLLFKNGSTVLALSDGYQHTPKSALVIPVNSKGSLWEFACRAKERLGRRGVRANPEWVPDMEERLVRLNVEDQLGFDICFRLDGRRMAKFGLPKFTKF